MREQEIAMLQETLAIMKQGYYFAGGKKRTLKLSRKEMEETAVYLPRDVEEISRWKDFPHVCILGRMGVSCCNMDAFALAEKRMKNIQYLTEQRGKRPLVLNLANPVHPGGGVRRGARAQEEDLCRKSSLLLSLESSQAAGYYTYNQSLKTYMGSDAVMITPNVEVIRDEQGNLMEDSVIVSVMTCAAPMLTYGMEGMTEEEYEEMVYGRITGMLKVAAYRGYTMLVLGAFGCGAFRNDARIVSDLFYRAIKEFNYDGMEAKDFFRTIDFAVLDRTASQYNYQQFARNFQEFYRDEDEKEVERILWRIRNCEEKWLDRIRGCLVGGAAGDALGYGVEFWNEKQIVKAYGPHGITSYDLVQGKAQISDDTQMSLFTANGILVRDTRVAMRGIGSDPRTYVADAYQDWMKTQRSDICRVNSHERYTEEGGVSWLLDVPELYALRAPGNTCMSALQQRKKSGYEDDYTKSIINHSKGCGGIMRIAPLALRYRPGENFFAGIEKLDWEAAQIAAITHSHSLGYMPAAVLCHIISRILTSSSKMSLKEIVLEARDRAETLFAGDAYLPELTGIIDRAVRFSENDLPDLENIHALGEGWVAEETLAIALYCALKYQNDFSKALTVSVNHRGDSDSTGAVTGNILGALIGYEAIPEKWKENLELKEVILEMAGDLCRGCHMEEYGHYYDPAWECKYMHMHRYRKEEKK